MENKAKYAEVPAPFDCTLSGGNSLIYSTYTPRILAMLNFLSVNKYRMAFFLSTYLKLEGWSTTSIGLMLLLQWITSIFVCAPLGDMIDRTHKKRIFMMIGYLILVLTSIVIFLEVDNVWLLIILTFAQGASVAVTPQVIYGLTLGLVESSQIVPQTAINEMCGHGGTFLFIFISALLTYHYGSVMLGWSVCLPTCLAAGLSLVIQSQQVHHHRAEGEVSRDVDDSTPSEYCEAEIDRTMSSVGRYIELVSDIRVVGWLFTVFLMQLGYFSILPLLTQIISVNIPDNREAILYLASCIVVSQATAVPVSALTALRLKNSHINGVFVFSLCMVPITVVLIILSLYYSVSNELLLVTQVGSGVVEGVYSVVSVVITEEMSRGSGHFNFVFGLVNTMHALGGGLSLLLTGIIVHMKGDMAAFSVLALLSLLPIPVYTMCMDESPSGWGSPCAETSPGSACTTSALSDLPTGAQLDSSHAFDPCFLRDDVVVLDTPMGRVNYWRSKEVEKHLIGSHVREGSSDWFVRSCDWLTRELDPQLESIQSEASQSYESSDAASSHVLPYRSVVNTLQTVVS